MTAPDEFELLRLLAAERYEEFERALPEWLENLDLTDPEQLDRARKLAEEALISARCKRAHCEMEVEELRAVRVFVGPRINQPKIDLLG